MHAAAVGNEAVLSENEADHNTLLKIHLRRDCGSDGDGEAVRPYYLIVSEEGLLRCVMGDAYCVMGSHEQINVSYEDVMSRHM